jgi:Icc-related predicted phosphoesterase
MALESKMRVFTVSDIHIDYAENLKWLLNISRSDYINDILILGGDVSHRENYLNICFHELTERFRIVLFTPGNHDLWVFGESQQSSIDKFQTVCALADQHGVLIKPYYGDQLSIIPLLGWYDYSFGLPSEELQAVWMDFAACRWPVGYDNPAITAFFVKQNEKYIETTNDTVISFSHFVPRIDVIPQYSLIKYGHLRPVLGSILIEQQIRRIVPNIHIYGHSHCTQNIVIDGVTYINNAFGYPRERNISRKSLLCVHES